MKRHEIKKALEKEKGKHYHAAIKEHAKHLAHREVAEAAYETPHHAPEHEAERGEKTSVTRVQSSDPRIHTDASARHG